MMESQGKNKRNLVTSCLLFCRRKLVYYSNVFHLMALSLTHSKTFSLTFLILHQLFLDKVCIGVFSTWLIKFSQSALSYKILPYPRWGLTQDLHIVNKDFLGKQMVIFKKGNGERGTENGEWEMRLTIYHKILHSEQFEGAEFIDDNSFLWFLTPVNVCTCLLGHSFGRRTANASILMKLCILHKSKALGSMVTIVFCSFWRPPVKFDTCQFWHC